MTKVFSVPRSAIRAGVLAGLAATVLGGCGSPPPDASATSPRDGRAPRLVVLYATCTVNKDYLSPYHPEVSYTPNLDKFARSSTVFNRHVTNAGQSGPAFASIFTGTGSHRHGVYFHPAKLSDDQYLLAEAYADSGYETFFWNNHAAASAELNYGQGVEPRNTFGYFLRGDDPRFVEILERLSRDADYKAFVVTNFTVTHGFYRPDNIVRFVSLYPAEVGDVTDAESRRYYSLYRENRFQLEWNFPETVARLGLSEEDVAKLAAVLELFYKSRIQYLDSLFGELVGQISTYGLMDDSAIVFTADHGETLYEEHMLFKWSHGLQLSPAVLNVPLIVHAPALGTAPGTWDGVTRSIDVFPTMLALSGIEPAASQPVEGTDLTPALRAGEPAGPVLAYSHTSPPREAPEWTLRNAFFPGRNADDIWTGVRDGDDFFRLRKLAGGEWDFEAFDLSRDPKAAEDLFDDRNPRHREMTKALRDFKTLLVANYGIDPERRLETERELSILRGLGYIQ